MSSLIMSSLFSIGEDELDLDDEVSYKSFSIWGQCIMYLVNAGYAKW